jgi:uncharacterized protein involved in exopolysaccharide biosynthesis/Mrp family chromosome partitioning ATPase
LRSLVQIVLRNIWIILGLVAASGLIGGAVIWNLDPVYRATALISFSDPAPSLPDGAASLDRGTITREDLLSELEVLNSFALMDRVSRKLELVKDPEFNPALEEDPTATDVDPRRIVGALSGALETMPIGQSRVVEIAGLSVEPEKSALIANALAEEYLLLTQELRLRNIDRIDEWYAARLTELKRRIAENEIALDRFRRDAGIFEGQSADLLTERLSRLDAELASARAERRGAEVKLASTAKSGGTESLPEVLASPLIQSLRGDVAVVQGELADLSARYGAKHPNVIQLQARLKDLHAAIRREEGHIVAALKDDVSRARAREAAVEQQVSVLQGDIDGQNESTIRYAGLKRELETSQEHYMTVLAQAEEIAGLGIAQAPPAELVSPASVPLNPYFPNKPLLMALVLLCGGVLSLLIVVLKESFDDGLRSGEEVARRLGLPTLALVPHTASPEGQWPEQKVTRAPADAFAESIRYLYAALLDLPPGPSRARCVMIASAHPGEGKTTVALSLARLASAAGSRTLIVNLDLHKPSQERFFAETPRVRSVDIYKAHFEEAGLPEDTEQHDLFVLSVPVATAQPMELLLDRGLDEMLTAARDVFDLIVLDSPPALAFADARVIARQADHVVLAAQWGSTPERALRQALRTLGREPSGVVITQVDPRRHRTYGYTDSSLYDSRHKECYAA